GTMGIGIWYYIYSRSVNSQLVGSTFFKGVLFAVQNDPRAIELLGSNIRFDPAVAPAKGFANTLKGRAEMTFPIVGNNDIVATVNFKG
ncbi:uncharacterized protein BJ171DRAFT_405477, partial [Polychytrium aggregatum]|uniref:uncharacterized protein n=1 Tax=Polychytrium aggregatum TaxID=110093 RepID=UPI0022FE9729